MGLGKTFQAICFMHTIMSHRKIQPIINRALIIVPKNVVINWQDEFKIWLNPDDGMTTLKVQTIVISFDTYD
jgi:SNF2 family DNA or RNA helicase